MNDELRALYQEVIIDHGRHPRNFKKLADASFHQEAYNPLCGDQLTLYLKIDNGIITDASFEGVGCAISVASSSLLTERVKNMTVAEAMALIESFHLMVTAPEPAANVQHSLGKLTVLGGVRDFPARIKCATLAWYALKAGLDDSKHEPTVTTE